MALKIICVQAFIISVVRGSDPIDRLSFLIPLSCINGWNNCVIEENNYYGQKVCRVYSNNNCIYRLSNISQNVEMPALSCEIILLALTQPR